VESDIWIKRDQTDGEFIAQKTSTPEPFKGVAKEPDRRRDNQNRRIENAPGPVGAGA
jgi:hypothetical protein